jgi:molecular chaperone GrpE (heat shock protein)
MFEEMNDWKAALRRDFESWLESVDEIPEWNERETRVPAPDLYAFYEQLAAGNVEARKSNRRTAEVFSQWGETLVKFDGDLRLLREQLARQPMGGTDEMPRRWALALVEFLDRMGRLAAAFSSPPSRSWLGGDARWRAAWETQRQGFQILLGHFESLLNNAGLTRIRVLHELFDPATMSAVATAPSADWPHQTVMEEVAPGYFLRGELLRVAQVKVSIQNDK